MQKGQTGILVLAGGIFYLGRTTAPESQNVTTPSPQPSPTLSPVPGMSPYGISIETKRRLNRSQTLAFCLASETPVFGPNDDPSDPFTLISDDPFEICFNGDTTYAIPSRAYQASPDIYVITPYIFETATEKLLSLPVIGEVKAPNGCTKITGWIDNNHLLRKACSEECICHRIDVRNNTAEPISC